MTEPRPNIVVRDADVKKYFSPAEWRELSAYERKQTRNVLRNHLVMISCGIKAALPFFITNFEARQNEAANEQSKQNFPSGSKKVVKSQPEKVKVSPREGHPKRSRSLPSKLRVEEAPKPRGRPAKSKATVPNGATGRGGEPSMKSALNSVVKSSMEPAVGPPSTVPNGTLLTRQQPPRRSKTLGGLLIRESIKSNRKSKAV